MMAVRRMGLELVFNLQWKNKPDHGGEKANVMGMYDTPATTQNFEIFKSYLLKNSGVAGNDVKITYITDNDGEWVIENPTCFEMALCAFRLKARLGEIIFLKLDKISEAKPGNIKKIMKKPSSDVETQYDEVQNIPPQWFLEHMAKMKKELVEEVTESVSNLVSNNNNNNDTNKVAAAEVTPAVLKKHRFEGCVKRSRKHLPHLPHPEICHAERDIMKGLKKYDSKLEKLDAKIKKTLEKKRTKTAALKTEDENQQESKEFHLDADSVNEGTMKPHMLGGERYLHTWEVINSGKAQWTSNVELRLTWGSIDMVPAVKAIPVPKLKSGEIGYISVLFQIPKTPGQYESYWNFYEKDCRFGQPLSFCVIVDPPTLNYVDMFKPSKIENKKAQNVVAKEEGASQSCPPGLILLDDFIKDFKENEKIYPTLAPAKNDLKPDLLDDCSDSDNQSAADSAEEILEAKKNDDFVLVPIPATRGSYRLTEEDEEQLTVELRKILTIGKNEEGVKNVAEVQKNDNEQVKEKTESDNNNNKSNNSSSESICKLEEEAPSEASYNMVCLSEDENDEEADGYIFIEVKGKKMLLPKKILHPDYVAAVDKPEKKVEKIEEKPQPSSFNCSFPLANPVIEKSTEISEKTSNAANMESYLSHCSAAGSCFSEKEKSGRYFIFPQNTPGFEVVAPPTSTDQDGGNVPVMPPPPAAATTTTTTTSHPCAAPGWIPAGDWRKYDYTSTAPTYESASPRPPFFTPFAPSQYPPYGTAVCSNYGTCPVVPNYQQTFKADPSCPVAPRSADPKSEQGTVKEEKQSASVQAQPKRETPVPEQTSEAAAAAAATPEEAAAVSSLKSPAEPQVHLLPENLVNGAVNVARSVLNMFTSPNRVEGQSGYWHNVPGVPLDKRARNVYILNDMGFWDNDRNLELLERYNDDVNKVVGELFANH